jgi:hypothetical protein
MSAKAGSGASYKDLFLLPACIALLLPLITLTPFCLGPVLARALASHNHELHLHLTLIAPYQNFAVAYGLTLLVVC